MMTYLAAVEGEHDVPESNLNRGPVHHHQPQLPVHDDTHAYTVAAGNPVDLSTRVDSTSYHNTKKNIMRVENQKTKKDAVAGGWSLVWY